MSLILGLLLIAPVPELDWSIDYTETIEGPRVVVEGTAHLFFESHNDNPCLQYEFEVPRGRMAGPAISCSPGQPILGFDSVLHTGNSVHIHWCRQVHQDRQTTPCSLPLDFVFYIIRDEFGPDDLLKLLSEWEATDSSWDLNLDGTVNGEDLMELLGSWENEYGGAS
tara:strand:- start:547 stop:1047 length:501 start_codon:yes stop_codon:yes gene_type:complete